MARISQWAGKSIKDAEIGDTGSYIHDFDKFFVSWIHVMVPEEVAKGILDGVAKALVTSPTVSLHNKDFICIGAYDIRLSFLASHDGTWWIHNCSLKY